MIGRLLCAVYQHRWVAHRDHHGRLVHQCLWCGVTLHGRK